MYLVYRNNARGQPWANRLAEGAGLVYVLKLRDRCRSGLSGSPGKRVLGKTNRGFESLPVRTLVRIGCLTSRRGRTDGAEAGPMGRIAGARSTQIHQPGGVSAKISGRQGINPEHKCKFQLLGIGRPVCTQPASFNIYTPKRSASGVATRRPT